MTTLEMLKEAGFEKAAGTVERLREVSVRLAQAYEHFRYVTPERWEEFQATLKATTFRCNLCGCRTLREDWGVTTCKCPHDVSHDTLITTPIKEYPHAPPGEVLEKVKEARGRGIFDAFEVASIKSVRVVPDPIVFGTINGCGDKFFIAQWGDDVRIEDILAEHEG